MTLFRLSSVSVLVLAAAFSVPANAKTVDILQQSEDLYAPEGGTPDRLKARGNYPNIYGGRAEQRVIRQSFGLYQLKQRDTGSGDPFTNFVAFCVDLSTLMSTSDTVPMEYETPGDVFGYGDEAKRRQLIGTLFVNQWDPLAGTEHQAAMQMTLWKIAHGDVTDATSDAFDLFAPSSEGLAGYLDYDTDPLGDPITKNMAESHPAVAALSASWLEALDGDGIGDWTQSLVDQIGVEYLTSADSQTVVTYAPPRPGPSPVPLPAGVVLLGTALGLVGAARKFRSA